MPQIIPLQVANPIEAKRSWQDFCQNPQDLLQWVIRTLGVDITNFTNLSPIIISDTEPVGADKEKIWIKPGNPPALGVPYGQVYTMFYPYPVNIPFLWLGMESTLPSYATKLTPDQLTDMGLTEPVNSDYFYAVIYA